MRYIIIYKILWYIVKMFTSYQNSFYRKIFNLNNYTIKLIQNTKLPPQRTYPILELKVSNLILQKRFSGKGHCRKKFKILLRRDTSCNLQAKDYIGREKKSNTQDLYIIR